MYALCDVNSMYASCEKVFDPKIRQKPVVVLTNNDGCICAACNIAKQKGVGKKFVPYFQVKDQLAQAGAIVRSSNYELYADLSQRMMDVCARFAPDYHIYSIDECFLFYGAGFNRTAEEWFDEAKLIRRTVWKEVRLPIGVGIGLTPTLAKAANHAAKKIQGFKGAAVIANDADRQHILSNMNVADVWGIGRKLQPKLAQLNIHTAWDLANQSPAIMKKTFNVLIEHTVRELNGEVCFSWDEDCKAKQQIYSTRSFGQRVTDSEVLRQAMTSHAAIVARKLRAQSSLVKTLIVFAHNSPHGQQPYYRRTLTHHFITPTNDARTLSHAASEAAKHIYREGILFYKCGVGAIELIAEEQAQPDLFYQGKDSPELMKSLDSINQRYGRDTIKLASQGVNQKFAMSRSFLSPQYTTNLAHIPRIICD